MEKLTKKEAKEIIMERATEWSSEEDNIFSSEDYKFLERNLKLQHIHIEKNEISYALAYDEKGNVDGKRTYISLNELEMV